MQFHHKFLLHHQPVFPVNSRAGYHLCHQAESQVKYPAIDRGKNQTSLLLWSRVNLHRKNRVNCPLDLPLYCPAEYHPHYQLDRQVAYQASLCLCLVINFHRKYRGIHRLDIQVSCSVHYQEDHQVEYPVRDRVKYLAKLQQ